VFPHQYTLSFIHWRLQLPARILPNFPTRFPPLDSFNAYIYIIQLYCIIPKMVFFGHETKTPPFFRRYSPWAPQGLIFCYILVLFFSLYSAPLLALTCNPDSAMMPLELNKDLALLAGMFILFFFFFSQFCKPPKTRFFHASFSFFPTSPYILPPLPHIQPILYPIPP